MIRTSTSAILTTLFFASTGCAVGADPDGGDPTPEGHGGGDVTDTSSGGTNTGTNSVGGGTVSVGGNGAGGEPNLGGSGGSSSGAGGGGSPSQPFTLPPACQPLLSESHYCLLLANYTVAFIGLDTGFTCTTGVAAPKGADTIGWVGDYVYLCKDDDTLQRVSLVDGSTDEVSISCKLVTDYNGAIMVHNQTSCPLSPKELTVFDTFQDVLNGTPSATISPVNVKGSRVAAQGSTLYHSWHSLSSDDQEDKIERIELPSGDDLSGVKPIGHDGWVNAIDVTTDGLLVIFNKPAGELEVYDAQTGSYVGAVSQTQYTLVDGIACVKTP